MCWIGCPFQVPPYSTQSLQATERCHVKFSTLKMTEYLALLDVVLKYSQGSIRFEFLGVSDQMIYLQKTLLHFIYLFNACMCAYVLTCLEDTGQLAGVSPSPFTMWILGSNSDCQA